MCWRMLWRGSEFVLGGAGGIIEAAVIGRCIDGVYLLWHSFRRGVGKEGV